MKQIPYVLVALALSMTAGCDEPSADGADDSVVEAEVAPQALDQIDHIRDGEVRINGEVLSEVVLEDGTELTFIKLRHDEPAVGLLRRIPDGAIDLMAQPEMRGANVLDIYWAVTEPGTAIPEAFEEAVPGGRPQGEQGWLLQHMLDRPLLKPRGTGTCLTNTSFVSAVEAPGYASQWIILDQEPSTSTRFVEYYNDWGSSWPSGSWPTHWRYSISGSTGHTVSNVERYITYVQVCALGTHPNFTDANTGEVIYWHPGPEIWFNSRSPTGSWYYDLQIDVSPSDVPDQWAWHFYSANNYDWQTDIRVAEQNDIFDIGHAWENLL